MSSYARANVRITNDKNKTKIPMRASRGLKWENKMYKLEVYWMSLNHVNPEMRESSNYAKLPCPSKSLASAPIKMYTTRKFIFFSSLICDERIKTIKFLQKKST